MLLDTCAAIWLMNGEPLTRESRAAIAAAQSSHAGIFVSPITAWEIATLAARKRIHLTLSPEGWFDTLLALPDMRLADMSPRVLIASLGLPDKPPKDPADRIIVATARAFGYAVVTRNGELTDYAQAGHIRVIAC